MDVVKAFILDVIARYLPTLHHNFRFNLITGHLVLRNLILPPSDVFLLASHPFQLTSGSVTELSARFPWTQLSSSPARLSARHLSLNFEELPLSSLPRIHNAFLRDSRQRKAILLADRDLPSTPFNRAIHKLIPLALQRVELDIKDLSISITLRDGLTATVSLDSLETQAPSSRADLSKTITLDNLNVSISSGPSSLLRILIPKIELQLNLADSRYDVHILLSRVVPISLSPAALVDAVTSLRVRNGFLHCAHHNGRPPTPVQSDPRSWLQYAARSVTSTAPRTLSLVQARTSLTQCIEYEHLHSRRLHGRLPTEDVNRIVALEDALPVDMIALLRDSAARSAHADQIAAFATTSWLRATLFSSEMTPEREQLAADIRHSLASLEDTYAGTDTTRPSTMESDPLDILSSQSSPLRTQLVERQENSAMGARLQLRLSASGLIVRLHPLGEEVLYSLSLGTISLQLHVDFATRAFSIGSEVFSAVLRDNRRDVIRCAGVAEDSASGPPSFFQMKVACSEIDETIHVRVTLEPILIFLEIVSFSRNILRLFETECNQTVRKVSFVKCDMSNSGVTESTFSGGTNHDISVVLETYFTRFHLVLMHGLPGNESPVLETALVFHITDTSVTSRIVPSVASGEVNCLVRVESCKAQCTSFLEQSLSDSQVRGISADGNVMVSTKLSGIFSSDEVELRLHDFVSAIRIEDSVVLMNRIRDSAASLKLLITKFASIFEKESSDSCTTSSNKKYSLHLPHAMFQLQERRCSTQSAESNEMDVVVTLARVLNYGDQISIAAENIKVIGTNTKGNISFNSHAQQPDGFLLHMNTKQSDSGNPEVELSFATVIIETGTEFIKGTLQMIDTAKMLFEERIPLTSYVNLPAETTQPQHGHTSNISCMARSLRINFQGHLNMSLTLTKVYAVINIPLLNGSCENVELADLSLPRGNFSTLVKSLQADDTTLGERRAFSFDIRPGYTNVQLDTLRVCIFREQLVKLQRTLEDFHKALNSLTGSQRSSPNSSNDSKNHLNQLGVSTVHPTLTIRGSQLSFVFPVTPSHLSSVRIDVPNLTAVISESTQVLSIRKITAMTGILSNGCVRCQEDKASIELIEDLTWDIVFRGLDVDLSHHYRPYPEEHSEEHNDQDVWSVSLLSQVTAYVAPSQVVIVRLVIESLFLGLADETKSIHTAEAIENSDSSTHLKSIGSSSSLVSPSMSTLQIKVETHALAVELLGEHEYGKVASTLAHVDLDPIMFSLHSAVRREEALIQSWVTNWKAVCPSFRIEDRDVATPDFRSAIVVTEDSWIGMGASSSQSLDDADVHMGLRVEAIIRYDEDTSVTSSHDIRVQGAQVIASQAFFSKVGGFITRCVGQGENVLKNTRNDSPSKLSTSESTVTENEDTCFAKFSVRLVEPTVSLFQTNGSIDDPHVEIRAASIKVSLLLSPENKLLSNSLLKAKDLNIVLVRIPERFQPEIVERGGSVLESPREGAGLHLLDQNGTPSFPSFLNHLSNMKRAKTMFLNKEDATIRDVESIVTFNSITIRPPTNGQEVIISIPTAVVDASVRGFHTALSVVPFLEIFQAKNQDAALTPDSDSHCFPAVRLVISSFSGRVKVATSTIPLIPDLFRRNYVVLRMRITTDTHITENAETLNGYVKISADVVDEHTNVCDNIIAPTAVNFNIKNTKDMIIDISAERFVRCTLSPLTAKTLISLSFLLNKKELGSTSYTGSGKPLCCQVNLKGVIIYCVAQEPRVQLLRIVLRDVLLAFHLPSSPEHVRSAELTLQDLIVEDTVPWSLYWREGERKDSVRWSHIVVGHPPKKLSRCTSSTRARRLLQTNRSYSNSLRLSNEVISEHNFEKRASSLLFCLLRWTSSAQDVSLEIALRGFDLNLDMGMIPSVLDWVSSIADEVESVRRSNPQDMPHSDVCDTYSSPLVSIDRIVIAPMTLKVAVRAPPRRLQEGIFYRLLGWMIHAEKVDAVNIEVPQVVFSGDFPNIEGLLERLLSLYTSELFSRKVVHQVVWQAPQFARMARVLAISTLRRREHYLIYRDHGTTLMRPIFVRAGSNIGLLGAIADRRLDRSSHTWTSWEGGLRRQSTVAEQSCTEVLEAESGSVETLDLT